MIKFTCKTAKNGRMMYFKNGKPCAVKNVPVGVVEQLEEGAEITIDSGNEPANVPENTTTQTVDGTPAKQAESKSKKTCVFCDKPANRQRYVNQEIIDLCDEDYDGHTTGEIVAQVRKVRPVEPVLEDQL